jgi:hypothetical protein
MADERSIHDDSRHTLHAPAHLLPGEYVQTQDGCYYPVHDDGSGIHKVHVRHFHAHEAVTRHRCAHPHVAEPAPPVASAMTAPAPAPVPEVPMPAEQPVSFDPFADPAPTNGAAKK